MKNIKINSALVLITILTLINTVSLFSDSYQYDNHGRLTKVIYSDGTNITYSYDKNGNILSVNSSTSGVNDNTSVADVTLEQNLPNPFSETTTIKYSLSKTVHVTLNIYNILGIKISNLVDKIQDAGDYQYTVSGNDLLPGVYYYELSTGFENYVKGMIYMEK